ncbi:hypothetical protein MTR67_036163 [Solanum verrucosum]|uniref:Uncharacterized protein n=1 Tax=Solanum verrucosum TaxID=315347 RepID=A0AAF0UBI3_SOLVR|nr:hypothetical protein MTR67_036163 [Solanum verrucosum]
METITPSCVRLLVLLAWHTTLCQILSSQFSRLLRLYPKCMWAAQILVFLAVLLQSLADLR